MNHFYDEILLEFDTSEGTTEREHPENITPFDARFT